MWSSAAARPLPGRPKPGLHVCPSRTRVDAGLGGPLLIVFMVRLCSLPSALVASSFFLSVVDSLGVLIGALLYACLH